MKYKLPNNIIKNVACHLFIMTIPMLFSDNQSNKKMAATNKCTFVAGHFDGHDNAPV
jgi:hypothetical protein